MWRFFAALWEADRLLAGAWWTILVLRGVLPAVFAIYHSHWEGKPTEIVGLFFWAFGIDLATSTLVSTTAKLKPTSLP
jgi:hypothetical protein